MNTKKSYTCAADYYTDLIDLLKLYDTRADLYEELREPKLLVQSNDEDWEKAEKAVRKHNLRIIEAEGHVAQRTKAAIKAGIPIPLLDLSDEFGLDQFDRMLLIRLLAVTIDPYFTRTPDIGEILKLLCPTTEARIEARKKFTTDSVLVSRGLIELDTNLATDEQRFLGIDLSLPRNIASRLLGDYSVKDKLQGFTELIEPAVDLSRVILPQDMIDEARRLVHNYADFLEARRTCGFDDIIPYGKGCIILFSGPPGTGKTMLAHALAKDMDRKVLAAHASHICDRMGINVHKFRNVFTEARLRNALVLFDEVDELFEHFNNTLLREFETVDDVCILATNKPLYIEPAMERRILCHLRFRQPTPAMRKRIWQCHIPQESIIAPHIDYDALATEFNLSGGYIKNAVLIALNRAATRNRPLRITQGDLEYGARSQITNAMRREAENDVSVPQISLDEVKLDKNARNLLNKFVRAGRCRETVFQDWGFGNKLSYGKGLAALFSGPSGTGKTMAAEAVAYELGMPLLRVSLATLVSKWVGDTAKNLARVFERSRKDNLILFFDEAEALFAARRGGEDANSFFINQDIDFLLTAMERHDGIVILASNNPEMFDTAFERRLQYHIRFAKPDAEQRLEIWQRHIPPSVPVDGMLDFAALAKEFRFTGGQIKNVVLRAAFAAASDEKSLSQEYLVAAAREEKPLVEEKHIGFARND